MEIFGSLRRPSHFTTTEIPMKETFVDYCIRHVDRLLRLYELNEEIALERWEDDGGPDLPHDTKSNR